MGAKHRYNKRETLRCADCGYLIYSVKKVKQNKHVYHVTCYKRTLFERQLLNHDAEVRVANEKTTDNPDAHNISSVSLGGA